MLFSSVPFVSSVVKKRAGSTARRGRRRRSRVKTGHMVRGGN